MNAQEIIERIQTAHWDMAACQCWVCKAARELGYRPREGYLVSRDGNRDKYPVPVFVEEPRT